MDMECAAQLHSTDLFFFGASFSFVAQRVLRRLRCGRVGRGFARCLELGAGARRFGVGFGFGLGRLFGLECRLRLRLGFGVGFGLRCSLWVERRSEGAVQRTSASDTHHYVPVRPLCAGSPPPSL